MPQLCRGIFDLLPAASLDATQPLSNLAKGCVVEFVEARDVEPLHHPAAVGVALPASVTVHSKRWAVEMNGKTPGQLAGGVAQVDRVAIAQCVRAPCRPGRRCGSEPHPGRRSD